VNSHNVRLHDLAARTHRCLERRPKHLVLDFFGMDPAAIMALVSASTVCRSSRRMCMHMTIADPMPYGRHCGIVGAQSQEIEGVSSLEHPLPLQRAQCDAGDGDVAHGEEQPPHRAGCSRGKSRLDLKNSSGAASAAVTTLGWISQGEIWRDVRQEMAGSGSGEVAQQRLAASRQS